MYLYSSKAEGKVPTRLLEIAEQVKKGEKPSPERVRELLRWFGVERRGWNVSYDIEEVLTKLGLQTKPDFRHAFIDSEIEFIQFQEKDEKNGQTLPQTENKSTEIAVQNTPLNTSLSEVAIEIPENSPSKTEFTDPTYRIGKLSSANNRPISVRPESSVKEIVTKMLTNDFSQLPVMTSDREVKGVVSWASIGKRLALGQPCNTAKDCMDDPEIISSDTSLFYAIDFIIKHEYVLVRDTSRVIVGIVTTTDLSMQFLQLTEPFLLISEIENHVRKLLSERFSKEDFVQARDPEDIERQIEDVSDLTFGEYIRLMENQTKWEKLNLNLDRSEFIKLLDEVRNIRNDVMHFDPDGISDTDLATLRKFVSLLQVLSKIGAI